MPYVSGLAPTWVTFIWRLGYFERKIGSDAACLMFSHRLCSRGLGERSDDGAFIFTFHSILGVSGKLQKDLPCTISSCAFVCGGSHDGRLRSLPVLRDNVFTCQCRQRQLCCFTCSIRSPGIIIDSIPQVHMSFRAVMFPQKTFPTGCNRSGLLARPSSSTLCTLELMRSASSLVRSRGLVIVSSTSTFNSSKFNLHHGQYGQSHDLPFIFTPLG